MSSRYFVLCILVSFLTATVGGGLVASATTDERNGLTDTQFAKLWSLDQDQYVTQTEYKRTHSDERTAIEALVTGSDWTWSSPPQTPSTWSQHEFATFEDTFETDRRTSIHPSGATLQTSEQGIIRDAHASIYRVHSATRVYVDRNTRRMYISQNGTINGFVDYRVVVPEGQDTRDRDIHWEIQEHRITEVCVLQGETPEPGQRSPCESDSKIGTGTGHTPSSAYTAQKSQGSTVFTLAAEIEVQLEKTVRENETTTVERCHRVQTDNGSQVKCKSVTESEWVIDRSTVTDHVTVTDSIKATTYRLQPTIRYASFPDGDVSVTAKADVPWSGVAINGQQAISSRWRFYSARDPTWDTLHEETAEGESTSPSPVRPVQLFAFPSTSPKYVTWKNLTVDELRLLNTSTESVQWSSPASRLPQSVNVDVTTRPYRTHETVVIRYAGDPTDITVTGLIPLSSSRINSPDKVEAIHNSNLTLSIIDRNRTHATVRVSLRDAQTQRPIDLNPQTGFVEVQGKRTLTNSSGIGLVRVSVDGIIDGEYHPEPWWHSPNQSYVAASDQLVVEPAAFAIDELGELVSQVLSVLLPILVSLFFVNRLPMIDCWPPWKILK